MANDQKSDDEPRADERRGSGYETRSMSPSGGRKRRRTLVGGKPKTKETPPDED